MDAIAQCRWFWRNPVDRAWVAKATSGAPVECRASVGEKVVTVWLPTGATIYRGITRLGDPWTQEFRYLYGTDRDKLIVFRLEPCESYLNDSYARSEGKSVAQLEAELKAVYGTYPEYSDPIFGGGNFAKMVVLFADDDFYKLHYVAKRYLALTA
jgi:hypothetical protein